ncbi:MAG: agmatine deiminase family protein [Fimbriimonadaceae bacterium]|nr:agmatine deiminase family protein [Fimbriimonadaceae bacterium]
MLIACLAAVSPAGLPSHPAEWARMESIWMAWATYDHRRGHSVHAVQARIIRALRGVARVDLIVQDAATEASARRQLRGLPHVRYHRRPGGEIWTRDFGPVFLSAPFGDRMAASYQFNYWGYDRDMGAQTQVIDRLDDYFGTKQTGSVIRSEIISEGGNREFNGQGTMLSVSAVEQDRNPGLSLDDLANEHQRTLGISQVVWLPYGGAEDDQTFRGPLPGDVYTVIATGGHVDNAARFTPSGAILVPYVTAAEAAKSPIARISRTRFLANEAALRKARDEMGRPFRLVRVPAPDPILTTMAPGDGVYDYISTLRYAKPFPKGKPVKVVLAASYLNFLIINGTIITSALWKPGRAASLKTKDAEMRAILRREFPKYRIVEIDSEAVNLGGGGIHCITQGMVAATQP